MQTAKQRADEKYRIKNRELIRAKNKIASKKWYDNPKNRAKKTLDNKEYREQHKEYFSKYLKDYFKTSTAKLKRIAREKIKNAIRYGKVKRQVCEITNCKKIGEAHHPDYSKPLEVVWLCKQHHADLHRLLFRQ